MTALSYPRIETAILSLIIGMLLVLGGLLSYFTSLYMTLEQNSHSRLLEIDVKKFDIHSGRGAISSDGLIIVGLDDNREFIRISWNIRPLRAEKIRKLHWEIEGLDDRSRMDLFWVDRSGTFHNMPFMHDGRNEGSTDLTGTGKWEDVVVTVGLLVRKPLDHPVIVKKINLEPVTPGPFVMLRQLWQQWSDTEGWKSHSINMVMSGNGVFIGPTPFVALWMSMSLIVYFFLVESLHLYSNLRQVFLIILVGWLVLDIRWQWDIGNQLQESIELFHGKSTIEKLMVYDDELIELTGKVKSIIPEESARIFLISDFLGADISARHNRVRYHLLPHNVHGLGTRLPPPHLIHPGDYILILIPLSGLRYETTSDNQTLFSENHELQVVLLLAEHESLLFRVRESS